MQIGDVIASIRRKKRIDQKELAIKLNKSIGYISQIENNRRTPSIKLLKAIASELNIPLSAILFELFENRHFNSKDGRALFQVAIPLMDDLIDLFSENKGESANSKKGLKKVAKRKARSTSKKISH